MVQFGFASVVSAIIGFLVIPIASRGFPSEEYGRINMFYSTGGILMSLFLLGLDNTYIRFFNEPLKTIDDKKIYSLGIVFSIAFGLIMTVVAFFLFPDTVLTVLFGKTEHKWLIVLLFIYAEAQVILRLQILNSRLQMKPLLYNIKQSLMFFTTRLTFVFSLFFSKSYVPSVAIMTISTVMAAVAISLLDRNKASIHYKKISKSDFRDVISFSLPTMPSAVLTFINNSISKFVLSAYKDFSSIGVLSMATSLANVFSVIPTAFSVYWSAYMYKNYRNEQEMIKKVHDWILLLSILITIGIFLFQDVLYLIIGETYRSSQAYFMVIMLMPIQSLIAETTSYGINISKKTFISLLISIVTCIINFGVSKALIPLYGGLGAAIGIGISSLFALALKSIYGQKYYRSITNAYKSISGVTIIIAVCICNYFVHNDLPLRVLLSILWTGLTIIVYRKQSKDILNKALIWLGKHN